MVQVDRTINFLELSKYDSLDPIHADNWNNMHIQRMLYLTPIEQTKDNKFTSTILNQFSYDKNTKTIHFEIKKGLLFSDGTTITTKDVLIGILRMARARPHFPVINNIVGLSHWLNDKKGHLNHLPSGIQFNFDSISIKLDKDTENPLFRFTFEIFSIIPSKCINPETNEIICEEIPVSGYYMIKKRDHQELQLKKRLSPLWNSGKNELPDEIKIRYIKYKDLENHFPEADVILGLTHNAPPGFFSQNKERQDFFFKFFPASNFVALLINSATPLFKNRSCRQEFANTFRNNFLQLSEEKADVQSSLFSEILPGHISSLNFSRGPNHLCKFKGETLKGFYYDDDLWPTYNLAIQKTANELDINFIPFDDSWEEIEKAFNSGEIAFAAFRSGFCSLDPVTDLQMLFTPNMHPILNDLTHDVTLREKLAHIDKTPNVDIDLKLKDFNSYLHSEAKFNVFLYTRYFYGSKQSNVLAPLSQSLAQPYLWQIF